MAQFGENDGFYSASYDQQIPGYEMGQTNFGQEQQFGQFDYNQGYPPSGNAQYSGSIFTPQAAPVYTAPPGGPEDYENEPPLMEELGINFDHILQKVGQIYFK
ncbi:hypothetical protein SNE40_016219 [Patella caerulea]|uniref:Uncharacterized protein n=1 Tax=Patella caerulea TaxID=87958 RepID=A0AAN8JAS7_PATCE